ncbi:hypothetical protein BGZ65_003923, partial [Modicella reniformis]
MVAMQSATADVAPSPPIHVSIHTTWTSPPLLLEILEAVAVENKTSYYPLMRQLTEPDFLNQVKSQQDLYAKSLEVIQSEGHVSPQALSTLKWSLAMHTTAPWIQAHYHLYNSTIVPDRISKHEFSPGCGVWVDWYDRQICTVSALEAIVAGGLSQFENKSDLKPTTMDLDHVQSSRSDSSLFAILYADVYDPAFITFRRCLDDLSREHGLQYSIRYRPPIKPTTDAPLVLAGYGVELALKSTDYIVIDDRDLGHGDDNAATSQTVMKADTDQSLFGDEVPLVEPVHQADLENLGVVTAQFVLQSTNPLKTLVAVAQDFPKYQRKLSKIALNITLKNAFHKNQMMTRDGRAKVWLNNQLIPQHKMNPFNLIRLIRRERQSLVSLATIGLSSKKAVDLLTDFGSLDDAESGSDAPTGVFDVRDKSDDKSLIVWLNDLENDQRYRDWSPSLFRILQPSFHGQFHQVRRNMINSLFVLDLSSPKSLELSFELSNFVMRMIPIRFGILPLVKSDDDEDARMAMLWRHLVARHGIKGGLKLLEKMVVEHIQGGHDIQSSSRKAFTAAMQLPKLKSTETPEMTYDNVIASDSTYRTWLESVKAMNNRVGINSPSHFVNGKYFAWNEDHAQQLMTEAPRQTAFLAGRLQRGELPEDVNVYEYFFTLPTVNSRRNPYIFTSEDSPIKIIDLVQGQSHPFVDNLSFISTGDISAQTTTILLAADFDGRQGIDIALESLLTLESDQQSVRVAFIQNGQPAKESVATLGNFIRHSSIDGKVLPIGFWKNLLQGIVNGHSFVESFKYSSNQHPEVMMIATEGGKGVEEENDRARRSFLVDTLKSKEGDILIIINGRVVGPINDSFSAEDFKLLITYEQHSRVAKIKKLLENAQIEPTASNIMKASSIILAASRQLDQGLYDINQEEITRDRLFENLDDEETGFTVNPSVHADDDDTLFYFTAVLDPVNELTQRWGSILLTLSQMDRVKVNVVLLPALELTEAPIKSAIAAPAALLAGLPEPTLLTLGVDVNPAWVVTSKVCIHDLDNLKLSSLAGSSRITGVQAEFELRHVLIEGFARDMTQKIPPKGAQFILGTTSEPHVADTLVMANMGYFQLKANPGVWEMVLRPGRTLQVFSIESIGSEGWVTGGVKNDKRDVVIANFEGLVLYPRLVRNPGMERANIQDEVIQEGSGIWDSIKSTFTGNSTKDPAKRKADINIFSVASGHLYERFLSIMILSVIKKTDSRVKFWFIENFLSPSFKDFIPHMAEKYDFDYELVTYNWPHWLRAQTEKQRVIWAYKILFLDVLFPLDLDKVIFVDADQIVRTDMKELVDLDLHGAP